MQINEKRPAFPIILIFCIASAMGNWLLSYIIFQTAGLPLYLDTVFTAAICFSLGLLPGLFTGFVLGLATTFFRYHFILGQIELAGASAVFTLCIAAEVLTICFFHKKWLGAREAAFLRSPAVSSFIGITPLLLTLVALVCIVVSFTGGLIDFTLTSLTTPRPHFPEDIFKLGLLRNNVPILASAILSRIPINIVDRFFVIFGGYGISLLYRKWFGTFQWGPAGRSS
ncbi:MAG: hypothetical protein FWG77_08320 [Treponema sp.]|nr:hypothetical protein [Treponema sp.]